MSKSLSVLLIEHQRNIANRNLAETAFIEVVAGLNLNVSGG
ncbi:hypothetical protein JCM19239_5818 [Vibrio variabilis]|uniref:Uncharacterized protein n=1 Tax=Vibrio variabilis TaxID=990271 RepID=A0ABQ0J8A0_9VIBR|nr:hypothetical protein JCM19239_5818 [Vibrio variabilis]